MHSTLTGMQSQVSAIKPATTNPPLRRTLSLRSGWRAALTVIALWLCGFGPAHAIDAKDLLPPDQAYSFSARSLAADMVRVEWRIADGYYLYRDKLRFESDQGEVGLGTPVLPPPTETKTDEFFGKMAIYRGTLTVDIPLLRGRDDPTSQFTLRAHSQGCADVGVCFPPHTQTANLQLIDAPPAAGNGGGLRGLFSSLGDKLGLKSQQEAFLDPEQAFVVTIDTPAPDRAVARWQIAEGYYLYRDKFAFALHDAEGVALGSYTFPPGVEKVDESFGRSEVYHNHVSFELPLTRNTTSAQVVTLEVRYQGCADAGLCYPPIIKNLPVSLPAAGSAVAANPPALPSSTGGFISEQDRYAQSLQSGDRLATLLSFFGVGILLAFTPCIFPMLPILSTLIVGQGAAVTTRRAFSLSLAYVLAMAVTYTIAGILAGLFGANLQTAFQNPWIIGGFSVLFVVLALGMFGFYNLQVPASWQTKLSELSNRQKSGTLIGAAVMGFLSALIVGPCVAAPLAGALIYIGQTGDAVLGGFALFAMSMGMGLPLLAIGTSAGKWLPKVSGWMNTVKAIFGVLLLALAIWMLERVIPPQLGLVLWGILLIITAVYMGAFDRLLPDATGWRKLWKGSGLVLMLYGALLLVGAAGGGNDVLQPLRGVSFASSSGANETHDLRFTRIKGQDGLNQALAGANGKTVMLDFYADWCVSCKEMERNTFSDAKVQAALANTLLLQADVTANDQQDQALLKQFGLFGPPGIVFFDARGTEQRPYRLVGYLGPEAFAAHIHRTFNGS